MNGQTNKYVIQFQVRHVSIANVVELLQIISLQAKEARRALPSAARLLREDASAGLSCSPTQQPRRGPWAWHLTDEEATDHEVEGK